MKRGKLFAVGLVVLALVGIPARSLPVRICVVTGQSMDPGIHHGEVWWMDAVAMRKRDLQRGDIVLFHQDSELVVKRVAGVPGDVIRERVGPGTGTSVSRCRLNSSTYRTWKRSAHGRHDSFITVRLGIGEYYVLGDNLPRSFDSRHFGPVQARSILGVLRPLSFTAMSEAMNDWLHAQPTVSSAAFTPPPDRTWRQGQDGGARILAHANVPRE